MAISFDESNDYFVISDNATLTLPDGEWCVGIWTKVGDNAGTAYQYLLSNNGYLANNSFNLHLFEDGASPAGQWQNSMEDGDGTNQTLASSSLPGADGKWRLIITQRTSVQFELWFCEPGQTATLEATDPITNFAAINGGNWNIGRRVDGDASRYYGSIACEFFVFNNISLSQAEIEAIGHGVLPYMLGYTPTTYLPMRTSVATLVDVFGANDASRQDSPSTVEHAPVMIPPGLACIRRDTITETSSLAGALTSAGTVARLITLGVLSGTLTTAGSIVRAITRSLAGTLTSAGAIARQVVKPLAGTLTSAGNLIRQAQKILSGTFSSAGAIIKSTSISQAGTLTSIGAIAKQITKSFSGALTSAGTITRQIGINLSAILSISGAIAKRIAISLTGTLTNSGILSAAKIALLALAGTLTSSGTLARQAGKSLAGILSSSGAIVKIVGVILSGVLNLAGAITTVYTEFISPANFGIINKGNFKAARRISDRGRRR